MGSLSPCGSRRAKLALRGLGSGVAVYRESETPHPYRICRCDPTSPTRGEVKSSVRSQCRRPDEFRQKRSILRDGGAAKCVVHADRDQIEVLTDAIDDHRAAGRRKTRDNEIGRASCRERVEIWVVGAT